MVTYGTTVIPSDQIEVLAGGTVAVSVAFETSIGLVGGMDTNNGSATPGDVEVVSSPTDAANLFGEDSELHRTVQLAFQNGAGTVYALPVEESSESESITGSGTLGNVPAFDPNVNPEHEITDGNGNDVNISYDPANETVSGTEAYVNPVDGTVEGDSGTTYDIQYDYGDYSAAAIEPLIDRSPRIVNILTENSSVVNTVVTDVNSRATNFDFMHIVGGADAEITNVPGFSNSIDERRVSLPYPSRGFLDEAETEEVRTSAAVGGYLAGLALGLSSTNDELGGLLSLRQPLAGPSEAGTLIDERVMPLIDYPPVTIVKDMTTSSEPRFERVYGMQIVDEATEVSHVVSRNFVGDQNTEANRNNLRRSHINAYIAMRDGTPPMLDDFTVSVQEHSSDDNTVVVNIGLDVVDIMDTIDVTITVGDVIRNQGAA